MQFSFGILEFSVENGRVYLSKLSKRELPKKRGVVDLVLSDDVHTSEFLASLGEGERLRYAGHTLLGDRLIIKQQSGRLATATYFEKYGDTNAVRVWTEVENISGEPVVLETVSALTLYGLGGRDEDEMYYTRFHQNRYAECQPIRNSFEQLGFFAFGGPDGQTKISFGNKGNCSSREEIPQGIIENRTAGYCLMFQIESNHLWYYEISEYIKTYYLHLGGANFGACGWRKTLRPQEKYSTVAAAIAVGKDEEAVLAQITKYRRHIARKCVSEQNLPAIFNEYMHLAWDNPYEENTKAYAPIVAKTGVEYYVIDCGWHTQSAEKEEDPYKVYSYIGEWKESLARFPSGLKSLSRYLSSLGMKLGLWIAPEQVGINCAAVLSKLPDECFVQRDGKKLQMNLNYMLDYRREETRSHMSEVIRRMVEEYGAGYIKFDCTAGQYLGTDYASENYADGLEQCADAFASWVKEQITRFPEVVFEACAGGGMRLDYKWLSLFSLVSTSDQINYLKYPYLAGNLLSAVLPEQAAVWGYPVTEDCRSESVSDERIYMNMINSFLGRLHLASHLERLNDRQLTLVKEGVDFYKSLVEEKKRSVPKFPSGFNRYSHGEAVGGFETEEALYLAVWNLGGELHKEIPLFNYKSAECVYPKANELKISYDKKKLTVDFTESYQARFFRLEK